MANVGIPIVVRRNNWADIRYVRVEKDVDGGGYSVVGNYAVPFVEAPGSGEVEYVYNYTFAYQYIPVESDIGQLTLRFTPLNADDLSVDDSLEPFTHGPIEVLEAPEQVAVEPVPIWTAITI